jgi:outer membrane protein OmpA-like peptidoglycan-associated protein
MTRRRHALAALLLAAPAAMLGLAACQNAPAQAPMRSVVFFTEDSAALDENGEAIVRGVAEAARARPDARVAVLGFAGPAGDRRFNQALSDARARRVADQLVAAGVDRRRIEVRARGPVAFEMMPTESRRVEIVLGG